MINFNLILVDQVIRVSVSCSCFSRVMMCIFFVSISVLIFFKNWHIFLAIHTILRYSCLRVVFIFLSVSCRIFCHILVIFSCRIKFVFISYLYRIAESYLKLPGLLTLQGGSATSSEFGFTNINSFWLGNQSRCHCRSLQFNHGYIYLYYSCPNTHAL